VADKDYGNKLTCQDCGVRFYDLKKKNPACPKCGAEPPQSKPKVRRAPPPPEAVPVKSKDEAASEVDKNVKIDDQADDTLIEEDSDDTGNDAVAAGIETVDDSKDTE